MKLSLPSTENHCSSFLLQYFLKNHRVIAAIVILVLILPINSYGQCSVSSLSISTDSSTFCSAPFTVAFSSQAVLDTTPVLLNSYTSVNSFQQAFTHNFPTLNNGCAYYMEMAGSAGLWLGTNRADAYAKFNGSNNSPYGPPGLSNWFLNIQPLSGLSSYNPAHIYNLVYSGDGSTISFGFFDNPYNDNNGTVTFKWYGIPCYQYDWDFGDGNTSTIKNPSHTFSNPGTYTVKLRITDLLSNCYLESTTVVSTITAPIANLGPDLSLCTGQSVAIDPGISNVTYNWQDNSQSPTFTVTAAGTYFVTVSNICGSHTDTVVATYSAIPVFNLGPDTTLCTGSSIVLSPGVQNAGYLWQDNSTGNSYTVNGPGTYSLTLSNFCGSSTDQIVISYLDFPVFNFGPDASRCDGENWVLNPGLSNVNYTWQDNSSASTFTVTSEGTYSLTAVNQCGSASDSIFVDYNSPPTVSLGPDTFLCEGEFFIISPVLNNTDNISYTWSGGSSASTFMAYDAGTYSLTVRNECGSNTDEISLSSRYCDCRLITPNTFTPDRNGFNDIFLPIIQCELLTFEMKIYNRYGETLFHTNDPTQGWDGTYKAVNSPMDTYSWMIDYSYTVPDNLIKEGRTTGQVMILR